MSEVGRNGARPRLLMVTALVCSILALILSTWAAYDSARTRDEIRRLGDLLAGSRSGAMRLEVVHPPELDPDDR